MLQSKTWPGLSRLIIRKLHSALALLPATLRASVGKRDHRVRDGITPTSASLNRTNHA